MLRSINPHYATTGVECTTFWIVVVPRNETIFWSEIATPFIRNRGVIIDVGEEIN
jgi:hypothetical protein